jgi:peptidoglycan/LPS O-acetylase OafA/YrhL
MRTVELPALRGISFYAALAVFLSHISVLTPEIERLSYGHKLFDLGKIGVSCFFVLSGFILTYNYRDLFARGVPSRSYKQFVWDRLSKIYPVHLATMLMTIPIQILSPNKPLDWRAVPVHALLLQCWLPFTKTTFFNYLNVPSWSISCEWLFYLLAPAAMFCVLGNIRRRVLLVAITATYACTLGLFLLHNQSAYARDFFVNWFAPSRFVDFLAGVFLARVFLSANAHKWAALAVPAQISGIVYLVAILYWKDHAPWPLHGGLIYVPGATLLVFGLAYSRGGFAAHLAGPWLRRLGMASFSFYMLQAPIIRSLRGVYFYLGWETRSWAGIWVVTVAVYLVLQTAAFIMLYKYELPMQKWLRSLRVRGAPTTKSPEIHEPSETFDSAHARPGMVAAKAVSP